MAHQVIEGEGLRTSYAFAPRVMTSAERNGPTTVRLAFASSAIYGGDDEVHTTLLAFEHVVGYEFNDFEFHRLSSKPQDVEFGLIEILDSPIVSEILSTGRYIGNGLRHFRISFDDHGTYDIVCEKFSATYRQAKPADLYD